MAKSLFFRLKSTWQFIAKRFSAISRHSASHKATSERTAQFFCHSLEKPRDLLAEIAEVSLKNIIRFIFDFFSSINFYRSRINRALALCVREKEERDA